METNVLNPTPEKEFERIVELSSLDLDYSALNDHFNDLTRLAAKIAGTDISLVNLLDSYTQWSISQHGLDLEQMPREDSVCQYTIMGDNSFEINALSEDNRFSKKDYVSGELKLDYYFGIPLKTSSGHNIGALCVMDKEVKELTPEKIEMLNIIGDEVVKRLEDLKEISDFKSQLEAAKEDKRKFSHDIRGPLGGIVGLARILEEQGGDTKLEEILQLAVMIRKGGESLLELADDILTNEVLPDGKPQPPKSNEFTLATLKQKLEKLYAPQAAAKDIDLSIVNENENALVPFPKNKIVQVIGNIISNAIKFTPKKGYVMVRQEYLKQEDTAELYFVIKDSGVGISEDKLNQIMHGESKSTSGTEGETGYGFGLELVKHLVDTMNGDLSIESKENDGCKFTVRLPLH